MKHPIFYILYSISFLLLIIPIAASAHQINLWGVPPGYWGGPLLSCNTQKDASGKFTNPCTSLCDLMHTFQHVIYLGISLAFFAIARVLLIWGGVLILISGPSPTVHEKGKKILTGTVIGILIVLGAFLIVNTFVVFIAKPGSVISSWANIQCNPAGLPGTLQK